MDVLFSRELCTGENKTEQFTVFYLSKNLFRARSESQIIILWKLDNKWEGVANFQHNEELLLLLGAAIDAYLLLVDSR